MSTHQHSTRGVIQAGQIKLLEPVTLADGTVVEVTIIVSPASEQARERQRRLLRQGFHLGGPPYPRREELYER
jgi:predicted DNA-binding antitoxin AbrB/MazE fold protein